MRLIEPGEAEAGARRAAGWLRRRGVRPGDRVAVVGANHPRLLELTLGALRSGVVPVPVNPSLAPPERELILSDCEPALVVGDIAAAPWSDAPPAELAPVPLGRPMLYTSGTTGRRKGVWTAPLGEDDARAWAADEQELWAPQPDCVTLVCAPLFHSAPHRSATAALLAGARVMLLDRFDAEAVARALAEHPVAGTFLVPTHLRRIFALGDPPRPRGSGRILHAGEPCPEPLKRRALEWFPGGALWEFYGSTEGQFTAISPGEWLERPGSVGRARRGRRLEITGAGEDGAGTVWVSAPPFARWEYWRDAGRTAEAWRGDLFTAGDVGRLDGDGYLSLVSRREDLIISGGVNVYPAEVERALAAHPAVSEAAAFGVPDDEWGQRVCVAVAGAVESVALERWCAGRLSPAERPKQFLVLDALPRNATGKVDRDALRATAAGA